jgi:RimJ/RimL family protein N-acetyltransferase
MVLDDVQLRPVTEDDLPLLERLHNTRPASGVAFEWFGFTDPARARRQWVENGLLSAESGSLVVVSNERAVGSVSWRPTPFGPLNRGWSIGIGLAEEAQGAGIGTRAQRLVAEYLFAHTEVNRIDAQTNVRNLAEQRALEKAGFTREGILRGAQFRNGEYHDMVSYSILRQEVPL